MVSYPARTITPRSGLTHTCSATGRAPPARIAGEGYHAALLYLTTTSAGPPIPPSCSKAPSDEAPPPPSPGFSPRPAIRATACPVWCTGGFGAASATGPAPVFDGGAGNTRHHTGTTIACVADRGILTVSASTATAPAGPVYVRVTAFLEAVSPAKICRVRCPGPQRGGGAGDVLQAVTATAVRWIEVNVNALPSTPRAAGESSQPEGRCRCARGRTSHCRERPLCPMLYCKSLRGG